MQMKKENKRNGEIAEDKFMDWLDQHGIPYLYIHQDPDTFSQELKYKYTKRPDFLVCLPRSRPILVDVKYGGSRGESETCLIKTYEPEEYKRLQEKFGLKSWYVISNNGNDYGTWFWASTDKIDKILKNLRQNKEKKYKNCYKVSIREFKRVLNYDSLKNMIESSEQSDTEILNSF